MPRLAWACVTRLTFLHDLQFRRGMQNGELDIAGFVYDGNIQ
jgi:hypothetical protein